MQRFLFIFNETTCGQATAVVTEGSDDNLRLYVSFFVVVFVSILFLFLFGLC